MTGISTPVRADGLVIKDSNGAAVATAMTVELAIAISAFINAAAQGQ